MKKKLILVLLFAFFATFIVPFTPSASTISTSEKILFTYLFGGTSKDYINQLTTTNQAIDIVSPNYFNLDNTGNLKTSVDQSFVNYIHTNGIKIVPFLSNHWDQGIAKLALKNREKLANDIVNAIKINNLDGINIDLENITAEDKEALNDLMRLLFEKLKPLNKHLSIAVAASEKSYTSGWKSAYDYKKLSNYADYIILMAYDEHWSNSKPGPIASIPWVSNVLDYTINLVPKDKILLGVPFYGRHWVNQKGRALHYKDAITLIEGYKGKLEFSESMGVPFSKFSDAEENYHEIWFENAQSLEYKMRLLNTYGIKGAASWRLGQEDPMVWNNFKLWLLGKYDNTQTLFIDIENHWAKNSILALYTKGYLQGYNTYKFGPDKLITRAETAVIVNRILNKTTSNISPYKDVNNNYWAFSAITALSEAGILKGVTSNIFEPETKLTRAQMSAILVRSFNLEPNNSPQTFSDVSNDYWAANEINILRSHGFIQGRGNNQFYPDDYISRAEMSAMIDRILVKMPELNY